MDRKTIAQEYFVLAVDENGNMPIMRKSESESGMVAAGIMDLLLHDVIIMEKKKFLVMKDMPDELESLLSLYEYLKEKPRSMDKLMSDYVLSTGKRIQQLTMDTGRALVTDHVAKEGKGGLFGNKTTYIPERSYKEELVKAIKTAVLYEKEISPHDMALIYILKETKNLNQYFSREEKDILKAVLREMKKNPQNKRLAEMINYVSDMMAIMASVVLTTSI